MVWLEVNPLCELFFNLAKKLVFSFWRQLTYTNYGFTPIEFKVYNTYTFKPATLALEHLILHFKSAPYTLQVYKSSCTLRRISTFSSNIHENELTNGRNIDSTIQHIKTVEESRRVNVLDFTSLLPTQIMEKRSLFPVSLDTHDLSVINTKNSGSTNNSKENHICTFLKQKRNVGVERNTSLLEMDHHVKKRKVCERSSSTIISTSLQNRSLNCQLLLNKNKRKLSLFRCSSNVIKSYGPEMPTNGISLFDHTFDSKNINQQQDIENVPVSSTENGSHYLTHGLDEFSNNVKHLESNNSFLMRSDYLKYHNIDDTDDTEAFNSAMIVEEQMSQEALVFRTWMPIRVESMHSLEHPKLRVNLSKHQHTLLYKCPLCDLNFEKPKQWVSLYEHYKIFHWKPRRYIGQYVCFPCRRAHTLFLTSQIVFNYFKYLQSLPVMSVESHEFREVKLENFNRVENKKEVINHNPFHQHKSKKKRSHHLSHKPADTVSLKRIQAGVLFLENIDNTAKNSLSSFNQIYEAIKLSGIEGIPEHFHCPSTQCQNFWFLTFQELKIHCKTYHPNTSLDPCRTPESPSVLHVPFLDTKCIRVLPLRQDDIQDTKDVLSTNIPKPIIVSSIFDGARALSKLFHFCEYRARSSLRTIGHHSLHKTTSSTSPTRFFPCFSLFSDSQSNKYPEITPVTEKKQNQQSAFLFHSINNEPKQSTALLSRVKNISTQVKGSIDLCGEERLQLNLLHHKRRVTFSNHVYEITFDKERSRHEKCGSSLGNTYNTNKNTNNHKKVIRIQEDILNDSLVQNQNVLKNELFSITQPIKDTP